MLKPFDSIPSKQICSIVQEDNKRAKLQIFFYVRQVLQYFYC